MNLPKLTENLNIHQSLEDQPTLSSSELKAKFDEAGNKIKDYINNILIEQLLTEIPKEISERLDSSLENLEEKLEKSHPVGSLYFSDNSENPAITLGFGSWEQIAKGRTLVGVDSSDEDFNIAGKTGGEKAHTLKVEEMPSHNHKYTRYDTYVALIDPSAGGSGREPKSTLSTLNTDSVGGNKPHNNMPPFYTTYIWKRIS